MAAEAAGRDEIDQPMAVDLDLLVRRLGGDVDLAAEIVRLFLGDCPARLTAVRTALDLGDANQVRIAAHALKGVAGNVAAAGLAEVARALERMATAGHIEEARTMWLKLSGEAAAAVACLERSNIPVPQECV